MEILYIFKENSNYKMPIKANIRGKNLSQNPIILKYHDFGPGLYLSQDSIQEFTVDEQGLS